MSAALATAAVLSDHVESAIAVREASLLRFLTCGSVDDGKSTLLGRLLFDSNAVLDDQLVALDRDSKKFGTHGDNRDFALLVDGLSAEREQGITIDVAYRYFSTPHRSFIVADTPGHEQYTRNMATGASTAELAIILVDARKGILPQTRRHSFIVSMVGVRHVVLAVNKMDLVNFDQAVYDGIVRAYTEAVAPLGFDTIVPIPLCAREGDNFADLSERTPWYRGAPLLRLLETIDIGEAPEQARRLHFPVQWVNRPNLDFRGYAGTIATGTARPGDKVTILPSGRETSIARIVTADGDLASASFGQAVTLTLADEVDVSRGDVIVDRASIMLARKALTVRLLWMGETPFARGQSFIIKLGTTEANADVTALLHAVDIHSFQDQPADSLATNGIGVAELAFDKPLMATAYGRDRELGSFILIDRMTNQTVALGTVEGDAQVPASTALQANDNVPGVLARLLGVPGSAQRHRLVSVVSRKAIETAVLFGIVLMVGGSAGLAVAVALTDLFARPAAGRLAEQIFAGGHPLAEGGHAD